MTTTLSGNIVDLHKRTIFSGKVVIADGLIASIQRDGSAVPNLPYILPGFVDAHIHIESSMLVPSEFARLAVVHGTVATVSDPHEIANVCGSEGIQYMIRDGLVHPFKFFFGASSCVPATAFETAGAIMNADAIEVLFRNDHLHYLSEMMNYPGVIAGDKVVMDKIAVAKKYGKPIDGHAPGLRGADLRRYVAAGISTDHECFTLEEALEKISLGMKIIIREGSAAKNYNALHPLLRSHPELTMLCSDDKHPDGLVEGHINALVRRSVALGYDLFDVLRSACLNPVVHYRLPVGTLRPVDPADLIVVNNLKDFKVLQTYIAGRKVAEEGKTLLSYTPAKAINNFHASPKRPEDFELKASEGQLRVIEACDGELITRQLQMTASIQDGRLVSDTSRDILKIAVVNRYQNAAPAVAFIRGFGLKRGALASSVAHDSHNVIAVGVDDISLCRAVNAIIEHKGGIAVVQGDIVDTLPLPVGGLMSTDDGYAVARQYTALDRQAKELGSKLQAPFMTLSFMALLVIPSLKLSDKGLFDATQWGFTNLQIAAEIPSK